jgi:hypothetical protein
MPTGTFNDVMKYLESKKHKLEMCTTGFGEIVDDSLKEPIEKLNQKIKELGVKSRLIGASISEEYKKVGGHPNDSDRDKLLGQMDLEFEASNCREHLAVIHQMKTIYLFRCVETTMKDMIRIAYPGTKTKGLFVWESMKGFFEGKGIMLPTIPGYEAVVDLKKVNNNLKHNSEVNEEVQKISEFVGDTSFTEFNLPAFMERISGPVKQFIPNLSEFIKDELYKFDFHRIDAVATEFAERMDNGVAEKFTKALLAKYQKPPVEFT